MVSTYMTFNRELAQVTGNRTRQLVGGLLAVLAGLFLGSVAGCGNLLPDQTTVLLVNTNDPGDVNENFNVEVTLYYADDQLILEDVLTTLGQQRTFTLAPGTSQTFSVDCENLQAIIIDQAELRVLGDIGPTQSSGVLRDGDDFQCGDTLVFTFSGQALPPELSIDFQTQ